MDLSILPPTAWTMKIMAVFELDGSLSGVNVSASRSMLQILLRSSQTVI